MPNKYMTIAGHSEGLIAKTCWKKAEEAIEKAAQSQDPVNRAILFYGGDSPENNHSHYYKNLKDMIKSLEGKVDPENIIVMHADGLHEGVDQNISIDKENPVCINSDLSFLDQDIAILPATRDGLERVFSMLKGSVKNSDHTFFYAFDHGGKSHLGESLTGWNEEQILDKEFARIVEGLPGYKVYALAECFSGGMAEDIKLDGKTCVIAATTADEPSWGDGFAKAFADNVKQEGIGTHDLFMKTEEQNPYAIDQTEHPQFYGADFSVFHSRDTQVENESGSNSYAAADHEVFSTVSGSSHSDEIIDFTALESMLSEETVSDFDDDDGDDDFLF